MENVVVSPSYLALTNTGSMMLMPTLPFTEFVAGSTFTLLGYKNTPSLIGSAGNPIWLRFNINGQSWSRDVMVPAIHRLSESIPSQFPKVCSGVNVAGRDEHDESDELGHEGSTLGGVPGAGGCGSSCTPFVWPASTWCELLRSFQCASGQQ